MPRSTWEILSGKLSLLALDGVVLESRKMEVFLRSALFHDLLKPSATMCKVLQEDVLCVERAIESVLKTKRSMDNLRETPFEELLTVKRVLEQIQQKDGSVSYQTAELKLYDLGIKVDWVESLP